MKSRIRSLVVSFAAVGSLLHAAPEIATQLDLSSATTPAARKFYFETTPGQRYSLWRSTDLRTWQEVAGFPKVADGMSLEHTFAQQDKEFFRIEPIDEQAPVIVAQYPTVDGFAVGRFADLSIQLDDATGINPSSIRLTVGASGQLAPGAPGLTISGNTITYDSGDAALGAWGATISATLIAADTLGHTLTHTWSFRLEPEPQVAANIFVFGSPTAQRAGQRVSGPAAALAARFPAPAGPQKAVAAPPWHIDSVLADRVIIAYEAGGAPPFAAGQLICNLAPAKESEIFYRRVVSTSVDAGNLKLTVMTSEAVLADFVTQGSTSMSDDAILLEFDSDGTLVKTVEKATTIGTISFDFSGTEFVIKGREAPYGDVLKLTMSELFWKWKTPRIQGELELGLNPKCVATISGDYEDSLVVDAQVIAALKDEMSIYDGRKKTVARVPAIGGVPIFATVTTDFNVKAKYDLKGIASYRFGQRETGWQKLGIDYRNFNLDFIKESQTYSIEPVPFSYQGSSVENSIGIEFEFVVELLFYKSAGASISVDITPAVKMVSTPQEPVSWWFELDSSVTLAPAGPLFEFLSIDTELSYPLLDKEWKLWPTASSPVLTFLTHPQSRTAAPGNDVSFTCTVDSPAPPSFQWYQNGRLLPGQTSRSLLLPHVNSGHAGSYSVTATAGALQATSNSATLTVQATTPENLDADGDGIPNLHETNTHTWVSTTNRGTNPNHWDSDGDGLSDGVESNTGIYVSRSNTGTNPNKYDTDGDGINDKREIDLGTEPNPPPAPSGFSLIPAGSLTMGQTGIAEPVHSVYVSAFYMAKYETTKELLDAVRAWGLNNGYTDLAVGNGSYASKGINHPVHSITWYDMVKWCNARSEKENLVPCYTVSGTTYKTGQNSAVVCNFAASGFRLPTEAEWEKAARGRVSGKLFPWGTDTITHNQANYYSSSSYAYDVSSTRDYHPTYYVGNYPYSSPVTSFTPNAYDLYNMSGNVWEWCWDWYGSYAAGSQTDPRGPASGSYRVFRGGSWSFVADYCRVAFRGYDGPSSSSYFIGFRVARSSVP